MKAQERAVGIVALSVVTVLSVAVTWAARTEHTRKLPQVVEQSIRKLFPHARIRTIEHERRIVRLIEVTVVEDGEEHDLILSEDGMILAIKREIDPGDLPTTVRNAVRELAGKANIEEAERIKVVAELRAVSTKETRIEYEAKFRSKGKEQEVIVSEDGTILKRPKKLRFG